MKPTLRSLLEGLIHKGSLEVIDADGVVHRFGDRQPSPVRVRFTRPDAERAVLRDPELRLGEEYVNGGLVIEVGSVLDLLGVLTSNLDRTPLPWWVAIRSGLRVTGDRLTDNNDLERARHNVHAHYDLDGRLYTLFLDSDLQYSCAYFEDGVTSLAEAQHAKKRHLASKLALRPGQKVLDIGSGWGGLGLYLAEHCGVDVTGVTLSDEQFAVSNRRAEERGLSDRVRFLLQDYRALEGPFDRIVSVGMFEHVGLSRYGEFFTSLRTLLSEDGVAVLHTIAKRGRPGPIGPWIKRYIFPGAHLPTLSELTPHIEGQGFWLTDVEVLRLHYADTLAAWNARFQARRAEAAELYDERFCRMWEFYLQSSEAAFRYQGLCVFQLQLAKQIEALPRTRAYMSDAEEGLRREERGSDSRRPLKLAGE